jgi:hypothetical protein
MTDHSRRTPPRDGAPDGTQDGARNDGAPGARDPFRMGRMLFVEAGARDPIDLDAIGARLLALADAAETQPKAVTIGGERPASVPVPRNGRARPRATGPDGSTGAGTIASGRRRVTAATTRDLPGGGHLDHEVTERVVMDDDPTRFDDVTIDRSPLVTWRLSGHPHLRDVQVIEPVRVDGSNLPFTHHDHMDARRTRNEDAVADGMPDASAAHGPDRGQGRVPTGDAQVLRSLAEAVMDSPTDIRGTKRGDLHRMLQDADERIAMLTAPLVDACSSPRRSHQRDRVEVLRDSPYGPGRIHLRSAPFNARSDATMHAPAWLDADPLVVRMRTDEVPDDRTIRVDGPTREIGVLTIEFSGMRPGTRDDGVPVPSETDPLHLLRAAALLPEEPALRLYIKGTDLPRDPRYALYDEPLEGGRA